MSLSPQQRQVLLSGRWFASLPTAFQDALIGAAAVVALRAGDRLFLRGDANEGLYAVLTGGVRFGAVSEQGKESTFAIAERSHWFGEVALLDGGRRTHDAFAESRTTTCRSIPRAFASLVAWSSWRRDTATAPKSGRPCSGSRRNVSAGC